MIFTEVFYFKMFLSHESFICMWFFPINFFKLFYVIFTNEFIFIWLLKIWFIYFHNSFPWFVCIHDFILKHFIYFHKWFIFSPHDSFSLTYLYKTYIFSPVSHTYNFHVHIFHVPCSHIVHVHDIFWHMISYSHNYMWKYLTTTWYWRDIFSVLLNLMLIVR